ncbi:MAG: hypothetical protein V4686_00855 [Patescibacteria group bacterium]
MKKLLLLIPIIALLFTLQASIIAVEETPVVENTLALCTDGIDNDGNFVLDLVDPSCAPFIPAPVENTLTLCGDLTDNDGDFLVDQSDTDCAPFAPVPPPAVENTLALCTDTVDNDGDLLADQSDTDCAPFAAPAPAVENTLALCSDDIENDGDILVDLSDPDCAPFAPILSSVENTLVLCTDNVDNDGDFLVDSSDPDCAPFAAPAPAVENTLALCSDDIENDGDILVDLSDPDCAPFVAQLSAVENNLVLCTDNIDNDGDLFVDLSDSDCAAFATTTPPTPAPTISTSGTGFTSFSGGSSNPITASSGVTISDTIIAPIDGEIAGCPALFTTYMKFGRKNHAGEVTRLQAFLNRNLGTKLSTSGFFNAETFSAVKLFQLKYSDSVLKPWVDAGLSTDLTTNPSGYVYLTTQRQINLLECPSANIPMPVLR